MGVNKIGRKLPLEVNISGARKKFKKRFDGVNCIIISYQALPYTNPPATEVWAIGEGDVDFGPSSFISIRCVLGTAGRKPPCYARPSVKRL